mgnify:CR=1 FL=1
MKIAVAAVTALLCSQGALAQAPEPQTFTAECTTKETGVDGVRHGCSSETAMLRAPQGFVFAERTLTGGEISGAGSEHSCNLAWDEYVEIVPGSEIQQPRVVKLSAKARSPKGRAAGRGWAKCKFTVKLSKYTPK